MGKLDVDNFDVIRESWRRYWKRDETARPLFIGTAVDHKRLGNRKCEHWEKAYSYSLTGDFDEALRQIDIVLDSTVYVGEALPYFSPDFGPDQFAAFLGSPLSHSEGSSSTSWSSPVVDSWESFLPLRLHTDSPTWKGINEYSAVLRQHSHDRYAVGVADLHSNIDALAALRGPQQLCMDFYECPDMVAEAMRQVRPLYQVIYNALHESGEMDKTGTIGWAPFWCEGKYATIQADFICMLGPEMCRTYVIPALEEEAAFLDHCVYHLDGPGALQHLDDILSISDIDVIQWVPGAGQPTPVHWLDVLKKCQKAGKGLQILDVDSLDTLKTLHRELDHRGLVYCMVNNTADQLYRALEWVEKNS